MNTPVLYGWKSFAEKEPPQSAAKDDPTVITKDSVLVTNNINARDRMGRMSHIWFAAPIKSNDSETGWCAYDEADRRLDSLTHWMDPFKIAEDLFDIVPPAYALIKTRDELLEELVIAHQIIANALNCMDINAKFEWAVRNRRNGIDGEGSTRANERLALIKQAKGGA